MTVKFHPRVEDILKEMGWERSPLESRYKGQWCTLVDGNVVSIDDNADLATHFYLTVVKDAEEKAFGIGRRIE
jgi:hypothetical protein